MASVCRRLEYSLGSTTLGVPAMGFKISALDIEPFRHLFGLDEAALARQGVMRMVAESNPGFPCRVSLSDASVGENVLLMNYEHQPMPSPFRSRHAIFVREKAVQAHPARDEIPQMLRQRLLSVRAFDDSGMMVDADLTAGDCCEDLIERMLANESANYLHLHNAKLGCYLASVTRA